MTDFVLQPHLDNLYQNQPRRLAFKATTQAEFISWQQTFKRELVQILGIAGRTLPAKPTAEKLQAVDNGQYIEEKYALDVGQGVLAPMYILVPKTPPPYKPIMAFHGHGPGVQIILGNYPDEATAQAKLVIDDNFAQVLAENGYLVCAVEQRGFGERVTDQYSEYGNSCRHLAFEYMMQGHTLLGERIWDGMVAASYVQNRDDVVADVLGITGHSGGGTTALWMSAIDDRITVNVTSCYFCAFKQSILGMRHCECNYVPRILELAEVGDLAAVLAPRPFRVIAGERDPIFPIAGVKQELETTQRAYDLLNVAKRISLTVHAGEHAYNHAMSLEWFKQWL